jgi:hypothetical protein
LKVTDGCLVGLMTAVSDSLRRRRGIGMSSRKRDGWLPYATTKAHTLPIPPGSRRGIEYLPSEPEIEQIEPGYEAVRGCPANRTYAGAIGIAPQYTEPV